MQDPKIVKYASFDTDSESDDDDHLKVCELISTVLSDPYFHNHITNIINDDIIDEIEHNINESEIGSFKMYSYKDFEDVSSAIYELIEDILDYIPKLIFRNIKPQLNNHIKDIFKNFLGE